MFPVLLYIDDSLRISEYIYVCRKLPFEMVEEFKYLGKTLTDQNSV